ncbi:MBL fold metallo-hydrolase [Candidatus Woesebacteria bacterium]|nr:MBL fold metallo-hydrolase [Candidatus Woesebacteria bacterium]
MPQKRRVKKLVVGQLQTNCYLVFDEKNSEAIIIDPGGDADYIIRTLNDLDVKPTKIVGTHGHFDHILAVNELKLAYKIPFLMSKKDEVLLKWMRKSCKFFTGFDPGPPPKVDKYLNKLLEVGDLKFEIIETPGHSPGSVSLYSNKLGIVFVGDVIFAGGGVGRTDFKYSNRKDLEKSIKKLFKLPKNTIVYSGHGEETTIGEEIP